MLDNKLYVFKKYIFLRNNFMQSFASKIRITKNIFFYLIKNQFITFF